MPRSRKIVDRRDKGLTPHSRIDSPKRSKRALKVIQDAGFSSEADALGAFEAIEGAIAFYHARIADHARSPRPSVRRKELEALTKYAESTLEASALLLEACECLSPDSRRAILDRDRRVPLRPESASLRRLQAELRVLVWRSKRATSRIPRDLGGAPRVDDKRALYLGIAAAWYRIPRGNIKGVKRIKEQRSGPLVDFVHAILDIEGIKIQKIHEDPVEAEQRLGQQLHRMQPRAKARAAEAVERERAYAEADDDRPILAQILSRKKRGKKPPR